MGETSRDDSDTTSSIGEQIRRLRAGRGMSQAQLAVTAGLSASYVSLIEAGRRAPTEKALQHLSRALRVAAEELLGGEAADPAAVASALSQARTDLEAGHPRRTLRRLSVLLRSYGGALRWDLECQVRVVIGYARYRSGDAPAGLAELEELLRQPDVPAEVLISLLRTMAMCYVESGDTARAVELARRGLDLAIGLGWTDAEEVLAAGPNGDGRQASVASQLGSDVIELGVTLASAYRERGDMLAADVIIRQVLELAGPAMPGLDRAELRHVVSLNAEASGDMRRAVLLAARAVGVPAEAAPAYQRARLQVAYARMLLNLGPKHAEQAEQQLRASEQVLREADGSSADMIQWCLQQARVKLITGELEGAIDITSEIARNPEVAGLDRADALMVLAQAQLRSGKIRPAVEALGQAQEKLLAVPPSRSVAQGWRELGDAYVTANSMWAAVEAYDRALTVAGVGRSATAG
jgi:transcriptional regulator with XRE-family HTH domain